MTEQRRSFASPEELEAWGAAFSTHLKVGDIVKITGPLGAGKTTLVRGVAAALGVSPDVVHSPTFSLVHDYEGRDFSIKHCDFYRLQDGSLLDEFGGLEFFDEPSVFLIEWPEKIGLWSSVTSSRLIHVDLQHDAGGRSMTLRGLSQIVD